MGCVNRIVNLSINVFFFISIVGAVLLFGLPSLAENGTVNWPQFRGPEASGLAAGFILPTTWNVETGEQILWQREIPGLAHASPIIWNERMYVATAVSAEKADLKVGLYGDINPADDRGPQQWRLICVDKSTGEVLWNRLGYEGIPRVMRHPKATHCNSTPATNGRAIVAVFGSEGLFCFDMNGELKWKKDLGPMNSGYFQVPSAQWGFGSSPVIYEDKVVVLCDVLDESFLAVFNLEDGKEIWRTPRKDVPTWGTPTITTVAGRAQILVNGWHHTGAYDFETGVEIWKLDGGGDIPVPTPIVAHGLAYFTSAHGSVRPIRAIRYQTAKGDITPPRVEDTNEAIAWVHDRKGNYMQTPIVVGEYLFACHDNGVLTCFDAKRGEIQYSERVGRGGGGFSASPVSDGKRLFFTGENGTVYIIRAENVFSLYAVNELGGNCLATPAISDGMIFFRTQTKLVAIGEKK